MGECKFHYCENENNNPKASSSHSYSTKILDMFCLLPKDAYQYRSSEMVIMYAEQVCYRIFVCEADQ